MHLQKNQKVLKRSDLKFGKLTQRAVFVRNINANLCEALILSLFETKTFKAFSTHCMKLHFSLHLQMLIQIKISIYATLIFKPHIFETQV